MEIVECWSFLFFKNSISIPVVIHLGRPADLPSAQPFKENRSLRRIQ